MKLMECTYGVLVTSADCPKEIDRIGMVVGITNNAQSCDKFTRSDPHRAIPLIQWSCGETTSMHHSNIKIYRK